VFSSLCNYIIYSVDQAVPFAPSKLAAGVGQRENVLRTLLIEKAPSSNVGSNFAFGNSRCLCARESER
jgi:hypothetical protein